MLPLKIQIPKELFSPAETASYEGSVDLEPMNMGMDTYTFKNPAKWHVDITNTGGALLAEGAVEVDACTTCARCLEEANLHLNGQIEGYFLLHGQETPEDLDDDEFEILPDDNRIDVYPLIKAALLLEFPLVALCQPDCKGLCPKCGANLNEGACDCAQTSQPQVGANNPFGVLADLHFE